MEMCTVSRQNQKPWNRQDLQGSMAAKKKAIKPTLQYLNTKKQGQTLGRAQEWCQGSASWKLSWERLWGGSKCWHEVRLMGQWEWPEGSLAAWRDPFHWKGDVQAWVQWGPRERDQETVQSFLSPPSPFSPSSFLPLLPLSLSLLPLLLFLILDIVSFWSLELTI